jgi:hypothetical protein
MKRFLGSDDGLELKIIKRGAKPEGINNLIINLKSLYQLSKINEI